MNKSHVDIDRFLPQGEMLRGFLEQPFLGKSDLVSLLRQRGVFVQGNDKKDTIPWITNLLVSPSEFDNLREAQTTKEDNPKVNTQTVNWDCDATLIDCVPDSFNINSVLDLEFSNFSVVGSPNFIPIKGDADHLRLDFEIERNDYSKNWANTKNIFQGSLELKKIREGKEVKLVVTHTASETKYVAAKATSGIIKHFKEKGRIAQNAEIKRIEFKDFTNSGRVHYFLSLTKNVSSALLYFEDIVDVGFSPDTNTKLPDSMQWMEKRIEGLKLKGKGLQHTLFVKDKALHPHIHLYQVLARYKFDYRGLTGKTVVSISFPEYGRSKDVTSELEVNVKNRFFDHALKHIGKDQIIKIILREFDKLKLASFDVLDSKYFA